MKKIILSLLFTALVVAGCSTDVDTFEDLPQTPSAELRGDWELVSITDMGVAREFPDCDFPQTVSVSFTVFETNLYDAPCQFETQVIDYSFEQNIITLTQSGITIKLRVLELDEVDLIFHIFYHTEEGGEFDGEIWVLERL